MAMLEYTFQHLTGYGDVKENELRKRKIYSWSDWEKAAFQQLNFDFYDHSTLLSESREKLYNKDAEFFTSRLPNHLRFLIPHSFPEDTLFLDIETTGLSLYYDRITLIGWSRLEKYKVLIPGVTDNEEEFLQELKNAKSVITFNGSMFDLPFIKKFYPNASI